MSSEQKKIIIIEDNRSIREGLVAVIQAAGKYEVVAHYDTCEEAIRNLDRDRPDVVLMDIELPGMSGIEGTSRIKKQCPDCVVLIITVFEDSDKVFQSLCAGAGGYIVKNANVGAVVKSIDEALAGGAPMSLHIASMVVKSFKLSVDSPLSERETQVLQGIAQGKTYTKIAAELFINKETVRSHIRNIYQKLAVHNKAEALRIAGTNRWIGSAL
ncbi:MAG: response regulator transcription factor [Sphingobacteriales bacterium]|nr:MAG: response regulator transcription factor [Sphingobacteriales bacterium]